MNDDVDFGCPNSAGGRPDPGGAFRLSGLSLKTRVVAATSHCVRALSAHRSELPHFA